VSKYGATKVAVESLIAQINSQCKIATVRLENRKIRYDKEIFKRNEHAPEGIATKDQSIDTKKSYLKIS
jgi:hypothetical protein